MIDANAYIDEINKRIDAVIKWGCNAIADGDKEIKLRAEQAVATFCEASLTAKKMPAIDPVKHGRWIKQNPMVDTEECSECGYNIPEEDFRTPFCPWCGALMVEGENDEL